MNDPVIRVHINVNLFILCNCYKNLPFHLTDESVNLSVHLFAWECLREFHENWRVHPFGSVGWFFAKITK